MNLYIFNVFNIGNHSQSTCTTDQLTIETSIGRLKASSGSLVEAIESLDDSSSSKQDGGEGLGHPEWGNTMLPNEL